MTAILPPPLLLDFRAETVEPILHQVAAGGSCTVSGIGSVGKSNLMRFLQRQDVHQKWLGDASAAFLFVYVDTNKMLKLSLWGLWELMLHQLVIELTNRGIDPAVLQTVEKLHVSAAKSKPRSLALRYLDRAVGLVCNHLELRLVFLIDEFDELCRTMPARGFAALRALRDDYKYRLGYVVATRLELRRLREAAQMEAFEELVTPYTFWLGPYSEKDARSVLSRLQGEYNFTLGEQTISQIIKVTGCHPGLLREAFQAAQMEPGTLQSLTGNPQVQDECQRIWLSLSTEEQQVLLHLANSASPQSHPAQILQRLYCKGLVVKTELSENQIFSDLFLDYIKQQNDVAGLPLYIDHRRHTVWLNGYESQGLTPLEYRLIAYLEQKQGQVCSRDEIVNHLYPDEIALVDAGIADSRIDAIVKRLRNRIEPNPKKPRYIITARGHGFQLMNSTEVDR